MPLLTIAISLLLLVYEEAMLAQSVCAALSNTSLELESRGPRSRSGSLQGQGAVTPGTARRLAKVDKAAVAFKVGGSAQLSLCAY